MASPVSMTHPVFARWTRQDSWPDGKYGVEVPATVRFLKIRPLRASFKAPGRTAPRSDGTRVAAVTYWTTSSRSSNAS
jgi:hypothetical protein